MKSNNPGLSLCCFAVALWVAACLFCSCGRSCSSPNGLFSAGSADSVVNYVYPFMGTDGPGNMYPGAQVPYGLVQLSPDNEQGGWDRISGYFYPDSVINSFSMTHLGGTGAGDLYDIAFMPLGIVEESQPVFHGGPYLTGSVFSHDRESAGAGYYSVFLNDYNEKVELTATQRVGFQRYTFAHGGTALVSLDLDRAINWDKTTYTQLRVLDSVTVEGFRKSTGWAKNQQYYFYIKFSGPFIKHEVIKGVHVFSFAMPDKGSLLVKCALSPVSERNATMNMQEELPGWDFDAVRAKARDLWESELGRVHVFPAGPSGCKKDSLLRLFYTCLYHSMLAPTIYMDANGEYRGPDYKVHKAENFTNYTRFSTWDTYRAANALQILLHPNRVSDMVNSFLAFFNQYGSLPVWNFEGQETDMMIAHHSIAMIAEAYIKGVGGFDAEKALEACVATADKDNGRGLGAFNESGYVPSDKFRESLSKTIEYCYDDYCIYMMAQKTGRSDIAEKFYKRAFYYRVLYNKPNGWFEPMDSRGKWLPGFNPYVYSEHITESNGWQYFFAAQHDIAGIIKIMGGRTAFAARLDSLFTTSAAKDEKLPIFSTGMIGQYVQGNEPSHHVAYLYDYIGEPAKTWKYVHNILTDLYAPVPNGYCGNEDCGQMSSWFVLSSLGLYPVNPVSGEYALTPSLFSKVLIDLPSGHKLEIRNDLASGMGGNNKVSVDFDKCSFYFNGKKLSGYFISHELLSGGGTLVFRCD